MMTGERSMAGSGAAAWTRRQALAAAAACSLTPAAALAGPDPSRRLAVPQASAAARALYAWLWSQYGRRTLTGQQENPGPPRDELAYIARVTGRQPALLGLDYIHPADWTGVRERALDWHRRGGVVTLCWHWGVPTIGTGYENSKRDFDVDAALREGTAENRAMVEQMDAVAGELAWLRDHGVPVLWRPYHEFSGDWFWWGKHGPDAFRALWTTMFTRFTVRHRLDNLIWVLGWAGQNVDPRYYPGRETVDIAGADIYAADHGNLAPMFAAVKRIVGGTVPICLHENGPIPDPATLGPDSEWLWFMTWHTRWLTGGNQNTPETLRAAYNAPRYLTLDAVADRPGSGRRGARTGR
ncbi:hypothetical protein GCM10011380_31860 [Sphingomonas metalli]|uniref:GH26 domain-containing protein n=2 Tax=Sphingomonas metalli TaxID=1779358 RepID=A0A916WXG7_9SPHN|nr:hypothetical protein GCM10011380_31860 [Sphingomonas metalli]